MIASTTTVIPHGFTWFGFFGMIAAVVIGITVGCYMDRRRFLHGLRAQIAMIREDIELSSDADWRDRSNPKSIENVWNQSLPEIRKTVFLALPHLMFPYESDRLVIYWKSLRDLNIRDYYEARSNDELLDRVLFDIPTETKKQAILRTLDRLEAYIYHP